MSASSPQKVLRQAEDYFRQRNYEKALATLSEGFSIDMEFRPFYTLAAQSLEQIDGGGEAQLFWQALEHFEDWEPFFNIGYHFIDAWHFDMAIPFLEKAYRLFPNNPDIIHELGLCYANTFQVRKAVKLLYNFEEHDFWTAYRLRRYQLLTQDLEGLGAYLGRAQEQLNHIEKDEEAILQAANLLDELRSMKQRHDQLPLPVEEIERQLAYWHFVQYGGVILQISTNKKTGGRFRDVKGSFKHVRAVLDALVSYLSLQNCEIRRIVYLENWNDAVLGKALAKLMDIPAEEADGENLSEEKQLIVAASNATYNGEQELLEALPSQVLFSLVTNWANPAMLCSDITGLLATGYDFPWEEPRGERYPRRDPHPKLDALVERILLATPPYKLELSYIYMKAGSLLPANEGFPPKRHAFRIESPIPHQ